MRNWLPKNTKHSFEELIKVFLASKESEIELFLGVV
jgi:hypothetical protein